jgi:hypothetical protein
MALFSSASLVCGLAPAARALPPPAPPTPLPRSAPTDSPTPAFSGPVLPYGSPIFFVLDDKINSGSTAPGTVIHMHLRSALVVGGVVLAPAEAPATLTVVTTAKAQTGDVDGAIQIHLDPLALPGRTQLLPIRAFHEYLTIEMTSGQLATRDTTDTIADVFVPYHSLYHALRKGRQMVLPVGSVLRAETDATIDASHPNALVISTPPPFVSTFDPPHADLTAAPFYTPAPMRPRPLPHGKPTLPPKIASPSPAPDTPASTASGVPAATASGVPAAAASGVPASGVPASAASGVPAATAATPRAASATPSPSAT